MFIEVRGVVDNNYILLYNYYNKKIVKEIKSRFFRDFEKRVPKGPF